MKIQSQLLSFAIVAVSLVLLTSCGEKRAKDQPIEHDQKVVEQVKPVAVSTPQYAVDEQFQKQVASVFTNYILLKDAFIASDPNKVKGEAEKVSQALAKVDMTLLTDAAHKDWMVYQQNLNKALKDMEGKSEIEVQRSALKDLSDELYKTIKAYGLGGATAYYDHCPMAFNNSGAYWLSDNSAIRNPYFGSKMLKCGSVEEQVN